MERISHCQMKNMKMLYGENKPLLDEQYEKWKMISGKNEDIS